MGYLQPVLADGMRPVLRASILPWTFSMEFITLLTLVPSLKPSTKMVANFLLVINGLVVGLAAMLWKIVSGKRIDKGSPA